MDLFHCQIQFAAEGALEEMEASAPSSSIVSDLRIDGDRSNEGVQC